MIISKNLEENISSLEALFTDCTDFVKRKFAVGREQPVWLYVAYIDAMTDRMAVELTVIAPLLRLGAERSMRPHYDNVYELFRDCGIDTADFNEVDDWNLMMYFLMAGESVFFIDGFDKAIVVASRAFPNRGIQSADTEVVVHGSREAFNEVVRFNTALVRRRIRDPNLKVKQSRLGHRSKTDIALMYLADLVRPAILEEVEKRLARIDTDAILDSGYVEQLIEDNWRSVFPQVQMTERPDKAASSILEGRIVILVDNSPFVLIVPVTLNAMFQASEDYYDRWQITSFVRVIRYIAAFFAVALPGFYLAVTTYHPSMIPLTLTLRMAAARQPVPFPAVLEILIMDMAFELLREAGIRLPRAAGGALGIVGGLIIGQAAVEAGLVSPIVVIVVALAGVSNFAIPHVSLVAGFRLVKYLILLLSAAFGLLGFWAGLLIILIHLAGLRSFGIPYLFPYASPEMNDYSDTKDSFFRLPLFTLKKRPFYANPENITRMK